MTTLGQLKYLHNGYGVVKVDGLGDFTARYADDDFVAEGLGNLSPADDMKFCLAGDLLFSMKCAAIGDVSTAYQRVPAGGLAASGKAGWAARRSVNGAKIFPAISVRTGRGFSHEVPFPNLIPDLWHQESAPASLAILRRVYVEQTRSNSAAAFSIVCDYIETHLASDSMSDVNELLSLLDPTRAGRMVSVGVLRTTFRARSALLGWFELCTQVAKYLENQGDDVSRVMRGLLPDNGCRSLPKQSSI